MGNAFFTKKPLNGVVLKFRPIGTSNCHDLLLKLTLSHVDEVNDSLLGLTFLLEEINPSISRIVSNNHQALFLPSKTIIG